MPDILVSGNCRRVNGFCFKPLQCVVLWPAATENEVIYTEFVVSVSHATGFRERQMPGTRRLHSLPLHKYICIPKENKLWRKRARAGKQPLHTQCGVPWRGINEAFLVGQNRTWENDR